MSQRVYVVRLWCGCYLCQRGAASSSRAYAMRMFRYEAEAAAVKHPGASVEAVTTHRRPWAGRKQA